MYKKIMIATDGSELSDKALHQGLALASSLNASVLITRVIPRYPTAYFEGAVMLDPQSIARIEASWHKEGELSMQKALELAAAKAVKARSSLITSDFVAESLITTAKKHKCDLIVMASHGYKAFKRLLLGSETLNVLTHSHIPVLVLR
jgi:nucleotide-binding universal stress UspA family protein